MTHTTTQLAELFSVTTKTVRAWMRAGMPVVKEGSQGAGNEAEIDLKAAVRWYFETNHERLELERQRARLASEQADRYARENAIGAGEVLELDVVERAWTDMFTAVRARILSLPTKVAAEVAAITDANAVRNRIYAEVEQILLECSQYDPGSEPTEHQGADEAGSIYSAPAPETHGKRVGRRKASAKSRE